MRRTVSPAEHPAPSTRCVRGARPVSPVVPRSSPRTSGTRISVRKSRRRSSSASTAPGSNNRLRSGLTYYRQRTSDALFPVAQTPSEGFGGEQLLNLGEIQNQGIELSLDGSLISQANWGWDLGVNVSTNKSEVLDLGGGTEFEALGGWIIEGQPVPGHPGLLRHQPGRDRRTDHRWRTTSTGRSFRRTPSARTLRSGSPGESWSRLAVSTAADNRMVDQPDVGAARRAFAALLSVLHGPGELATPCSRAFRPSGRRAARRIWSARASTCATADYFKLRTVTASIPVDFAFPDQISSSTLTLSLNNSFLWMRDSPWGDPELLGNQGANATGLGQTERMPTPISFRASLRLTF